MNNKQKWFDRVAAQYGMDVSADAAMVLEGLEMNKAQHGARYCPCKVQKTSDNICPCVEMRTQGFCHCGLFV